MKLFYAPPSPFARKARAAIIELGMEDRVSLEKTSVAPGNPNEIYIRDHNPLGKIPALTTDDGDTIYDSSLICDYLNSESAHKNLIPSHGQDRWRVLTQHSLAHGICESAVTIRYETFLRPEAQQWQVWLDDQWSKIDRALTWFSDNQTQWRGDINIAQLTLGCALAYLDFRSPDYPWRTTHSDLADWFQDISERPSFSATLPTADQ